MNVDNFHILANELLLKLSICSPNKQKQIFQKYVDMSPKFMIQKVKKILMEYHPFLSFELIEFLNKSNFSKETGINKKSADKLDDCLNLSLLRFKAKSDQSKKIVVFCQPKSGSTFLTNIIAETLKLDIQNLNTFAYKPTMFGINNREQELCELSLLKSVFRSSNNGGFIAQHHTKANAYLNNQIDYFNIKPIILTRNIFDSLVSNDDFIVENHRHAKENNYSNYLINGNEVVPQNYSELSSEQRLDFLTKSYGIWYVQFYLSWKRYLKDLNNSFCWITYEDNILNYKNLEKNISDFLNLDEIEIKKLNKTFYNHENIQTRFNKGITGRGNKISDESKKFLKDYAYSFSEFDEYDLNNLFGSK